MKKIDKIFKSRLKHQESKYSQDLWSKIESELDQAKDSKPRFGIFLPTLGLILILFSVGLYFGLKEQTVMPELIKTDENTSEVLHNSTAVTLTNKFGEEKTEIVETSAMDDHEKKASVDKLVLQSKTQQNGVSGQSEKAKVYASNTSQLHADELFTIETHENIPSVQDISFSDSANNQVANDILSRQVNNAVASKIRVQKIKTIQPQYYSFINSTKPPKYNHNEVGECGQKEEKYSSFSLDLYVSPEIAFRTLNTVGSSDNSYLVQRERSEIPALSFSAGFRLSYQTSGGLDFRTGLNYTQINENFEFIEEISTSTTIITETPNPETGEIIRDTTMETSLTELDQGTRNSFKSVDIPLLVGMTLAMNQRLNININTGVYLNASFSTRGKILAPETLRPVWVSSNSGDLEVFKSSLGISYYGSIGLLYELSPGLELLVEPNLRYYSQSFTLGDFPLTQDYLKVGVLTGLRYQF